MARDDAPRSRRLSEQAIALAVLGRVEDAARLCREVLDQSPGDGWGLAAAAATALAAGARSKALEFAAQGRNRAYADVALLTTLGEFYLRAKDINSAHAVARDAMARSTTAQLHNQCGVLLSMCSDHASARAEFRLAASLTPEDAVVRANLAKEQRFAGDFVAAEHDFDEAIARNPADWESYFLRSGLRTQSHDRNHLKEMEEILARPEIPWLARVHLGYALSKEYDDLGRIEQSYAHLSKAATTFRAHATYSVAQDLELMDHVARTFSTDARAKHMSGCDSRQPIFIVGLPRSGTTLVERMLGCHSDVAMGGELQEFEWQLDVLLQMDGRKSFRGASSAELLGLDFKALGEKYIAATQYVAKSRARCTNKLPTNYLHIGAITRSLPRAKIIVVRRNAMDTCWSLFRTLFRGVCLYSYEFGELATYYAAYDRLTSCWRDVAGDQILEIAYERLVRDPEVELQRIFAFCDLSWESSALRFFENSEAVTTASAVQVRQPLSAAMNGHWRRYEPFLAALISKLMELGVSFGPEHP